MVGYFCERCPLAFEVGYRVYWDLDGACAQYVCRHCGTMHRIDHSPERPEMVFTAAGPVRFMVSKPSGANETLLAFLQPSLPEVLWQAVGCLPAADPDPQGTSIRPADAWPSRLGHVVCAYCGIAEGLVSGESFGDNCPVCQSDLQAVYVDS